MAHTGHTLKGFYQKHRDMFTVAGMVAAWRLVFELFGQYANVRWRFLEPDLPTWRPEYRAISDIWSRWDSEWYYRIIQHGYVAPTDPLEQSNVVFFPLYPYVVKFFSELFNANPFYMGSFLSFVFCVVAMMLLYKLLVLDYKKDLALRAIFYILLFPMSFFFIAMYTESLFLVLMIGALYAARKGKWWWAGALGFFVSLTRLVGVVIFVPLAIEYMQARNWNFKAIKKDVVSLLLVPAGLASFMLFLQIRFSDALLFLHAQSAWLRTFEMPWTTIARDYLPLLHPFSYSVIGTNRGDIVELLYFAFGLVAIILTFFFTRKSYAILSLLLFVPAVTGGQLTSIGRYLLVIFPIFILLAKAGRFKWFNTFYIFLALIALAENVMLYVLTHWIA